MTQTNEYLCENVSYSITKARALYRLDLEADWLEPAAQ